MNPEKNILIKTFFLQISDLFLLAKTLQVFKSCFEHIFFRGKGLPIYLSYPLSLKRYTVMKVQEQNCSYLLKWHISLALCNLEDLLWFCNCFSCLGCIQGAKRHLVSFTGCLTSIGQLYSAYNALKIYIYMWNIKEIGFLQYLSECLSDKRLIYFILSNSGKNIYIYMYIYYKKNIYIYLFSLRYLLEYLKCLYYKIKCSLSNQILLRGGEVKCGHEPWKEIA